MEWLSQSWIWVISIVGVVLLFSRIRHGSLMGGCGMQGMAHEGPAGDARAGGSTDAAPTPTAQKKAPQAAEGTASSHHRGRGGCC